MQLRLSDVDRIDMRCTMAQKHIREAAGRGTNIDKYAIARRIAEMRQSFLQFQRPARDKIMRRFSLNHIIGRYGHGRFFGGDAIDRHLPRLNGGGGAGAAFK